MSPRGNVNQYVLIALLVGLAALLVLGRFGTSIRHRYEDASRQVDSTVAREGEAPAAPAAGSEGTEAEEQSADGEVLTTGSLPEERTKSDGKVHVGAFAFDIQTIVWLGILIVVVTLMIVARIFSTAAKGVANPVRKSSR